MLLKVKERMIEMLAFIGNLGPWEFILILFIIFKIVLYCLPAIIAYSKDSPAKVKILLINLILGWTVIGWLWALVWSLKRD